MRPMLATLLVALLVCGSAPRSHARIGDATEDLALGVRQVEEGELEEAVVTLASAVKRLSTERAREKDLSVAHLYLALAHLGLSEWEVAKANMRLAWRNDKAMRLDPKLFPPRLLQLYDDIRREGEAASEAAPRASVTPPATAPAKAEASRGGKGTNPALIVGVGIGGAAIAGAAIALSGGGSSAPTTSAATVPPTTLPARRTDTFAFTLSRAALDRSVVVGPVRVRAGVLTVTLAFAGDYIILACVGTVSACRPMGGRPQTQSYDIPVDFPAGNIQASVYFNRNFSQPQGDPTGTVSFTYDPQ